MAITQAMCTSFKAEILDEVHDLAADTLKIALYTSSASDKAIAVLNFGGDFTVSSGTFRIVFPAAGANAIITIA